MKNMTSAQMAVAALMCALICIFGPLTIPIGPVPISMAMIAIFLSVYLLGMRLGTVSVLLYLLIGLVGVPVFSGMTGGVQKLFGPTGGYLIGYIFLALIAGWFVDHFQGNILFSFIGMLLGTAVLYAFGTVWLSIQASMSMQAALAAGVLPFIGLDLMKMVVSLLIGVPVKRALLAARLLQQTAVKE